MNAITEYEATLDQGIVLFNEGKFNQAHEAWKPLWLEADDPRDKEFLGGLILIARAFLHYVKRECAGAAALLAKSRDALEQGVNIHPEIRLPEFVRALDTLRETFDRCLFDVQTADLPRIATYGRPFVQRQLY